MNAASLPVSTPLAACGREPPQPEGVGDIDDGVVHHIVELVAKLDEEIETPHGNQKQGHDGFSELV